MSKSTIASLPVLIKEYIDHYVKFKSLSLPDKFIFENSSREKLLDSNGLSIKNISKEIVNLISYF